MISPRILLSSLALLPALSSGAAPGSPLELEVQDAARQRTVPILVYLPPSGNTKTAPVVLFSHGLGGSRHGSSYLGQHWSSHGYVCVFLQHPGSDESVWKDVERSQVMEAMRNAASLENFLARTQDVTRVLDQLQRWSRQPDHPLADRMDLERVGMSGHSFGAVTTQAVMGQASPQGVARFRDPRIDAAIAFSPSPPQAGTPETAFANVRLPVLAMTGTLDNDPVRNLTTPEDRRKVYASLPPGNKFQLVFEGGRHSAFSDRPMRLEPPRHARIHPAILALTTAFWDAYLRDDEKAKAWLRGPEARKHLAPGDVWEWQ